MSDQQSIASPDPSRIPANAVEPDGNDLGIPIAALLRKLGMLPAEGDTSEGLQAAFGSTPASVAVIKAGALALSKWWAAGLGAAVVAAWSSIQLWFPSQESGLQETVIWSISIATGAVVLGIAYIVASDVRGRAAATVATLQSRSNVAEAVIREATSLYKPESADPVSQVLSLPKVLPVKWTRQEAANEDGWNASAMRITGDNVELWLARGSVQEWVPTSEIIHD